MRTQILEREHELRLLAQAVREAATGGGSVVLVEGEAGIGKSSLLNALRDRLDESSRMLVGRCDDLTLPRILGPFRDLVGTVGPELTAALENPTDRERILTALVSELQRGPGHVTVLAVEDVQWAEEPTLDVLRFLMRRVADLPVVLLLTFRDDEVDRTHPLHQLLGVAPGEVTTRRLSLNACRRRQCRS